MRLTRRSVIASLGALALLPVRAAHPQEPFPVDMEEGRKLAYKFQRKEMAFETAEPAGTVVVDARKCFLYFVLGGGRAIRYGVTLGKLAHAWDGEVTVKKMAEWPVWVPAPYHIGVQPALAKWLPDGMPGGPGNPLGARALYLFKGEVDTVNRIHGAARVTDIGRKATAGCIGMINADVIDLYGRVQVGTRVLMLAKGGLFG